ncbi:glycosyltransferase family 39 protein [Paenibacillus sp. UNC451MF]|uniref:glycosyltransferase family 39 protein n=1 Tax=Paenibacillus sp. UNC451MF TaxID=1449063 RepID=UPI000490298B|nr:glycosyltransferase family 39 protein [Paenibacillus sp. UNC451MF]
MSLLFRIYHKYKDRDFIFTIPLVILALDQILSYYFWIIRSGQGLPQSEDSQWYIDYANALMTNFSIGTSMNDILYLGYNLLITLLLALFKDPAKIVFIQAITAGLSVILVFKITRMLFNKTAAIIASYFYYDAWEVTLWSMYILSDSFFISLLLLCIFFLLKVYESNKRIYKILFVVSSLYMLVFRPTGIILMGFILLYIVIRTNRKTMLNLVKKYKYVLGGCGVAVIAACIYLFSGNTLDPLITSLQFNAKKVLYNVYAKGWIYDKATPHDHYFRPNYDINIFNSLILSFLINNWDHISIIYGKRVIAFLGRWVWETNITSLSGIKKLAEHLLPSLFFLIGTIIAMVNGTFRKASIIWLCALAIFIFCILVFIDAMYRYRAPAIPFIAIAAGYGAERVIYGVYLIAKKYAGKLSRYGTRKSVNSDSGF